MRTMKIILSTIATIALLGATVAADPSPNAKGDLKVAKAVLVDTQEDVADKIFTTRLGSTSEYDEVNANLKMAADSIQAAGEKPENLKGLSADAVKETVGDNASIALVFDSSMIDGGYKKNDKRIAITYVWSAADGDNVQAIHMGEDGTWSFADTKVNGDTITVTSDGNSPFAFLVGKRFGDGGNKGGDGDPGKKSPQTGEYVTKAVLVGAAALMVVGLVCVSRAKKSSAN